VSQVHTLTMPKWGLSMKEGKVVDWLVDEGTAVRPGMELVDVETDKIAGEVEAPPGMEGVLRRRVADVGDVLPVGALLGVVAADDVSDADVTAVIDDFQARFVPGEADEEEGPATADVDVSGTRIRYVQVGDGADVVVLVHGFGGDKDNWRFNLGPLAEDRTVLALDLPGHGESAKQVTDGSVAGLAEVLAGFLDAMALQRPHVVGHSLGAAAALAVAADQPGRVASLGLVAGAGLGREIDVHYLRGFVAAQSRRDLKPHVEKLFGDPALVNRQLLDDLLRAKRLDGAQAALEAVLAGFVDDEGQVTVLADRVAMVGVPVVVVHGEADRIIPAAHAKALGDEASVHVLPGRGHMVHLEAAGEVNRLLAEHLG
jgi:pyruvate dehydrogenase E2 component (dihydrolipoamide acetyltransferase)